MEQITGTTVLYYHQDQIGSNRLMTNAAGAVVASVAYDPYGTTTASTGTVSNPFGFAGEYRGQESGLVYLRARDYDPGTGQFLTRDPLVALARRPYGYVSGNPLNATDPSGLVSGGLCATGSIGVLLRGFAQACVVIAIDDRDGTVTAGFTETNTTGVGVQTHTVGGVFSVRGSSARNVRQLGGPFGYGGLSATEGPKFGGGIFAGSCPDAPGGFVGGAEVNVGAGFALPLPAEVHGGQSNTQTQSTRSFNPLGIFSDIGKGIRDLGAYGHGSPMRYR